MNSVVTSLELKEQEPEQEPECEKPEREQLSAVPSITCGNVALCGDCRRAGATERCGDLYCMAKTGGRQVEREQLGQEPEHNCGSTSSLAYPQASNDANRKQK